MTQASLSSLLSAAITVFVALIFVRAAWHKLSEFTEFTGFVADYKVLPERLVVPVSAAIVGAELLVVLLQLVPGGQVFGLVLALALFGTYAAAMTINIVRGRTSIECGCGGAVQPLSWSLVGRNGVLMAVTLLAALLAPYALDAAGAATALFSGFAIWVGFLLSEQILANASLARLTR